MAKLNFKKTNKKEEEIKDFWKILIVDDEHEIHKVTKTVLSDIIIEGKGLEFLSAYGEEEAISILKKHDDIVLVLLDVIMESDDSGLKVAHKIRNELNNNLIRIVLRTGQSGTVPEREVIVKYKINDYKEKSELTADKLFTTLVVAIRSYQDLYAIKKNQEGLEQIIDSTKAIFEQRSLKMFAEGVLTQLTSLLNLDNESMLLNSKGALSIEKSKSDYNIIASTGELKSKSIYNDIDEDIKKQIDDVISSEESKFFEDSYIGYFKFKDDLVYIVYVQVVSI